MATDERPSSTVRVGRRQPLPALTDDPILDRLDGPPPPVPPTSESLHDKARRALIAQPNQWLVLNTRVKLTEAAARRLARSYQHAKPARLQPQATGRFTARPFTRDHTWHVAASYQPDTNPTPNDD